MRIEITTSDGKVQVFDDVAQVNANDAVMVLATFRDGLRNGERLHILTRGPASAVDTSALRPAKVTFAA